jgi:hypothetical protein
MHYRMLVTITLPDGATSEKARQTVHDTLLSDDSFCGSGGRFGSVGAELDTVATLVKGA